MGWGRFAVVSETVQVACAGCGTLHRFTEENGGCHITALPGPVRTSRTVTLPDGWGREFETQEWYSEAH